MRVTITVHGEDLGDVEVDRTAYVRLVSDDPRETLRGVLNDAVAQVQDAYRLTTT